MATQRRAEASPTGQRYINHRQGGSNILLFVRRTGKLGARTTPYIFLGFADYVARTRAADRLRVAPHRPMPADFFREAKVAAG